MKNGETAKANYLRLDRPQQMGSVASSLKRIGTNIQFKDEPGYQVALAAIEECQRLTEWLITTLNLQADDSDLNLAEMFLQVGRQASQWKYDWQHCCQSSAKCEEVATISEQWSKQMLERSGVMFQTCVLNLQKLYSQQILSNKATRLKHYLLIILNATSELRQISGNHRSK